MVDSRFMKFAGLAIATMAILTQYSGAIIVHEWHLYGTVISASTCAPIAGAKISSPFNNNAYNISSASGNYLITLGEGSWTITASDNGYVSGNYTTPYESTGALQHNFALITLGGSVGNCLTGKSNVTVINNNATTTPTTTPTNSTSPSGQTASSGGNNTGLIIAAGVIIVVVIGAAAYALTRPKKPVHHHQQ